MGGAVSLWGTTTDIEDSTFTNNSAVSYEGGSSLGGALYLRGGRWGGAPVLEPGCKSVAVRPHLGHLKWAEGTFPTPWGVIRVRHERGADGKVSTSVSAPDGVRVVR